MVRVLRSLWKLDTGRTGYVHEAEKVSYNVVTSEIMSACAGASFWRSWSQKKTLKELRGRDFIVHMDGSERYDRHRPSHDSRRPLEKSISTPAPKKRLGFDAP